MIKGQLTQLQKRIFFPYLEQLAREGYDIPTLQIGRLLMIRFDTGPHMAAQVQREYVASKKEIA